MANASHISDFGAAIVSDRYAADALRAAAEIMTSVSRWQAESRQQGKFAFRIGASVATGPIIFGAVGDPNRLEYTVIGEAVNVAAKLEKHNKKENVRALCTAQAFDEATRQGYRPPGTVRRLTQREVAGIGSTMDIVVIAD
jgi:adenylate cyclase